MKIEDLKQEILNRTLNDDLIIFVCSDNSFIAESYINEICEQKNLSKNYVKSLAETTESALSLVFDFSNDMNIIKARVLDKDEEGYIKDKTVFNEVHESYSEFKNCVVICNAVSAQIKSAVADYIVEVPKLTDWQVKAYMLAKCPGLNEKALDWLYEACCHDIYKLDSEMTKLSLIEPEKQLETMRELIADKNSDLFIKESVFKLVDALIIGDKRTALDFLKHADYYSRPYTSSEGKKERDLDPVGLTSLLLMKLKNILLLNYKSGITPDELGVSKGAAYYLKQQNVPLSKLSQMIDFLSGIDSRLKTNPSSLDFIGCRDSALLEYIILNMLAFNE